MNITIDIGEHLQNLLWTPVIIWCVFFVWKFFEGNED